MSNEKKYTIKDLSEGRVAVVNDGTIEQLQTVIKWAFPKEKSTPAGAPFYLQNEDYRNSWVGRYFVKNIPTQSVADFLSPVQSEEWEDADKLWYEVKVIFMEAMEAYRSPEYAVKILKSKYKLTKIQ